MFRLDESRLDEDMLGHDDSHFIEQAMPSGLSPTDREQFLSFCARQDIEFFVTKDRGFATYMARDRVLEPYGLRVGRPEDCLLWLRPIPRHD